MDVLFWGNVKRFSCPVKRIEQYDLQQTVEIKDATLWKNVFVCLLTADGFGNGTCAIVPPASKSRLETQVE